MNELDWRIDCGNQPGTGGQTDRIPSTFRRRCNSGRSFARGNIGAGMMPSRSIASKLSESKPVLRASALITRTFFSPAASAFVETNATDSGTTSMAVRRPASLRSRAAGKVKYPVPHPTSKTTCPGKISAPLRISVGLKNLYRNRLSIPAANALMNTLPKADAANASVSIFPLWCVTGKGQEIGPHSSRITGC